MDIDKMYGYSDAKRIMQEIAQERQEREQQRSQTIGYAAQLVPTGIKGYKSEQQIGAKELKELQFTPEGGNPTDVFQTSAEHIDKSWYDPGKFFAKSRDMVQPTQGLLDEITRLEGLQQAQTITSPEMELLTKYKSYATPDPAVGMGQKMKNLLGGAQPATTAGSTAGSTTATTAGSTTSSLGSKAGGGLSAAFAGAEMGSKGFSKRSGGYKAATGAQLATGLLSFIPGMQWMSLVSGGLGAGKGFIK